MTYCEHDDDPNSCPPCRNARTPIRAAPKLTSSTPRGASTDARFKTQCPGCRSLIRIGDRVTKTDYGWVCEDCAENV